MGLDCSHDAWHGAYSTFMRWRQEIASAAGLPPLDLMEGFYAPLDSSGATLYHGMSTNAPAYGPDSKPYLAGLDQQLPIRWDCLKPSALHELLHHSDCDGEIPSARCAPMADALEALLPLLPDECWQTRTEKFIAGLRSAAEAGEPLDFH